MRVLENSREIAAALQNLFSNSGRRRVALVAFIGADAEPYLPAPKGIELICWDKLVPSLKTAVRVFLKQIGATSESRAELLFPNGTISFQQLRGLWAVLRANEPA